MYIQVVSKEHPEDSGFPTRTPTNRLSPKIRDKAGFGLGYGGHQQSQPRDTVRSVPTEDGYQRLSIFGTRKPMLPSV